MENTLYPWGGEFTSCNLDSCVAVVLLNIDYTPCNKVAIYGRLKTENIGIEKIVANIISNPNIRFLVLCGDDIRGHRSGKSLIALNKNGIDSQNRIIDAPGAIPYIENISKEAIIRFQKQIETIDLIGIRDPKDIDKKIRDFLDRSPGCFGEPYIAIKISSKSAEKIEDKRALHSKIMVDYTGRVEKRGK